MNVWLVVLASVLAAPGAASDMSDGECVRWVREACPTVHFDKAGRPVCRAKRRRPLEAGECADRAFGPDALREADEEPEGLDDYARWRYASSPVPDDVLDSMGAETLRVFRNTFFAGHGRIFKDAELDAYFRGFAWYKPRTDFRASDLSETETRNAARAAESEARLRKAAARAGGRTPARGR